MPTPLEELQQRMVQLGEVMPDEKTKWARRFLAGGAVYFLLGGREVRLVVATGAVYYMVQKKVIQERTEEATAKAVESFSEMKKRLFGK